MFRKAAVVSILCLLAGAAAAEEAIPTAQGARIPDASQEPLPPPLKAPTGVQLAPVQPGPCGLGPSPRFAPVGADGQPQVDRSPHGEVTVGVGSGGSHLVGGAVCMPLKDRGFVAIQASQETFPAWRR